MCYWTFIERETVGGIIKYCEIFIKTQVEYWFQAYEAEDNAEFLKQKEVVWAMNKTKNN